MIKFLKKHIIWVLIVGVLLIGISFGAGLLVKNWPLLTLDTEFKITDIFSLLISIAIALLIPFYIKYFIDKGNKVNNMVLDEVVRYRDHLEQTHQRFFSIFQSGSISDSNKSEINVYCEMLDSKFEILSTILMARCEADAETYINELKNHQIEYWRILTSIEINSLSISEIHPTTFLKEIKCHEFLTKTIMNINLLITNY